MDRDFVNEIFQVLNYEKTSLSVKNFSTAIKICKKYHSDELNDLMKHKQLTHFRLCSLIRPDIPINSPANSPPPQLKRRISSESFQLNNNNNANISDMSKKTKIDDIDSQRPIISPPKANQISQNQLSIVEHSPVNNSDPQMEHKFDLVCSQLVTKEIQEVPGDIMNGIKVFMNENKISYLPKDNDNIVCKKYLDFRSKKNNLPFYQAFAQKILKDENDRKVAALEAERIRLEEENNRRLMEELRMKEEEKRLKKEQRIQLLSNLINNFGDLPCSDRIVGDLDYGIAADETLGYNTSIGVAQNLYRKLVEASTRDKFNAPLIHLLAPNNKSLFVRYQPLEMDEDNRFIFVSPLVYAELQGPERVTMKWCTSITQAKKINFVAFDSEGIENIKEIVHDELERTLDKYGGFMVGQSIPLNINERIVTLIIERIIDSDNLSVPVAQIAHSIDVGYEVRTDEEAFDETNFIELPDDFYNDDVANVAFGMAIDENEIPANQNSNLNYNPIGLVDDGFDEMNIDNGDNGDEGDEGEDNIVNNDEHHGRENFNDDFGFFDALREMRNSGNDVAIVEFNEDIDGASGEVVNLFNNVIHRGSQVVAVYDRKENGIRLWARSGLIGHHMSNDEKRMHLLSAHGRALDFLRGGRYISPSTFSGSWVIHNTRGLFIIGTISENGEINFLR